MEPTRCFWVNGKNPLYVRYHDEEWARPCHDEQKLYEMLLLECFQAGLSWECILNKRENFRRAFDGFDARKVAAYGEEKLSSLLHDSGIIRNRRKIEAAVTNSRVFLQIQAEFGSFDAYLWGFTGGKSLREPCTERTVSPLSDAISKDLKKRGMRFVGSTTVYSYLQAVGVLAAHTDECFCAREEQLRRIAREEALLDQAAAACETLREALEAYRAAKAPLAELAAYYESEVWRRDFEDDEAGLLPQTLKRGVLSEDTLYDLLSEEKKLRLDMRTLAEEGEPEAEA